MDKKNVPPNPDDVIEVVGEIFEIGENDLLLKVNNELYKGLTLEENWKEYQLSRKRQMKEMLLREKNKIENKEIAQTIKACEMLNQKDVKFIKKQINEIKKNNKYLIESALATYENSVKKIYKLSKQQDLRKAIVDVIENNVDIGLKTVSHNGKKWGYKEYMEMSVRNSIHNEIVNQQLDMSIETKQIFYICNTFGNVANDHAAFQGKIYYNEAWESFGLKDEIYEKVRNLIRDKKLISYQAITDGTHKYIDAYGKERGVYLCTRPNCRHRMFPITIDQALNMSTKDLIDKFKLNLYGNKSKVKTENTQYLRYCERNIRKYKFQVKQLQDLYNKDKTNLEVLEKLNRKKELVSKWDDEAEYTVKKSKGYLRRDFRREERRVILNDLGVNYEKGIDLSKYI